MQYFYRYALVLLIAKNNFDSSTSAFCVRISHRFRKYHVSVVCAKCAHVSNKIFLTKRICTLGEHKFASYDDIGFVRPKSTAISANDGIILLLQSSTRMLCEDVTVFRVSCRELHQNRSGRTVFLRLYH